MSKTLDILKQQHQAIVDYEARRERLLGPRDENGVIEVRRIVKAHLALWKSSGGKAEDFLLAGMQEGKAPQPSKAKHPVSKGQ